MKNKLKITWALLLAASIVFSNVSVPVSATASEIGETAEVYAEIDDDGSEEYPIEYDEYDGYIEMPWDEEVPAADSKISFREAKDILVKDSEGPDRGIWDDDFDLPSAWPCSYTSTDVLNSWFDTKLAPLRNQGSEGTCWAQSSISLLEHYLMFHNGSDLEGYVNRNSVGNIHGVNYSELQLAYFYYHNTENPIISGQTDSISVPGTKSFMAIGGNLRLAAQTLSKWRGAVDETLVPYSLTSTFTTGDELRALSGMPEYLAYKDDLVHLKNEYQISIKNNTAQVKQAIKENGAVGVSFHSGKDYYNKEHNSFYNYVDTDTTHAVNIVGWDDDFPAWYFGDGDHRPSENGAWLIRNSWMDTLKNPEKEKLCYEGYFWMSYEDTSLKDAAYAFEAGPSDDYDNNYYYTNQLYNIGAIGMDNAANVFTVNGTAGAGEERVEAVILQTSKSNVPYSISIYSVDEDGKPSAPITDDYQVTEGTMVFPGIYTIPLKQPVTFSRGEKFAIYVRTPGVYALGAECDLTSTYYSSDVNANPGESFYFWNGSWEDIYDLEISKASWSTYGNVCIQALTTDVGTSVKPVEGVKILNRGADSIALTWDGISGSVTYNVYRSIGSYDEGSFVKVGSNLSLTAFTDSDIPANSRCYYRVVPVVNGSEVKARSSRTIATAVKASNDPELETTVETQWTGFGGRKAVYGKTVEGAEGYRIKYKKAGSSEWIEQDTESVKSSGVYYWVFYTDKLPAGVYSFSVRPFFQNEFGERGYGYPTEEKNLIAFYPAPEKLIASYDQGQNAVTLKWKPVSGAKKYKIYTLRTESGTTYHTKLGYATDCTFVHQGVSKNTTYRYAVYAYDADISDGSFNVEDNWKYAKRVELEIITDDEMAHYLAGDVNGDGAVNPKDITALKRYLVGDAISIRNKNSDVDGDGTVSSKDVSILRRYLSGGWNIELDF